MPSALHHGSEKGGGLGVGQAAAGKGAAVSANVATGGGAGGRRGDEQAVCATAGEGRRCGWPDAENGRWEVRVSGENGSCST